MKQQLFILFISLFSLEVVNAQTVEIVGELNPVQSNIGKFSKKLPVKNNRVLRKDNYKFLVKAEPLDLLGGKKGVVIEIQVAYKESVWTDVGGKPTARIYLYGRITSEDKVTDGFFEEQLFENVNKWDELLESLEKMIIFRKVFQLSEGKYQVGVILRDINSGLRGVKVVKFKINNRKAIRKFSSKSPKQMNLLEKRSDLDKNLHSTINDQPPATAGGTDLRNHTASDCEVKLNALSFIAGNSELLPILSGLPTISTFPLASI